MIVVVVRSGRIRHGVSGRTTMIKFGLQCGKSRNRQCRFNRTTTTTTVSIAATRHTEYCAVFWVVAVVVTCLCRCAPPYLASCSEYSDLYSGQLENCFVVLLFLPYIFQMTQQRIY